MSLVIVGSIGLDTIESPAGKVVDAPGGSAMYASLSATYFCPVKIVGVVGEDFPQANLEMLRSKSVNLEGLEIVPGKTFRWSGRYENYNTAQTLSTELNVFADFQPKLPSSCRTCHSLFLANIHPDLQLKVLDDVQEYSIVACDTMNYWIQLCPDRLIEVIKRVNILFINEDEIRQLTGIKDIYQAAHHLMKIGPSLVVIKRGEYGAVIVSGESYYFAPAYPIPQVKDTTGAGDSFAGGFLGYICAQGELSDATIRTALRYGTVMAALNVSEFSVHGLMQADQQVIEDMQEKLRAWLA